MVRNIVGAGIFLALAVTFATAEEFNASIRKVDGDKVTFVKMKKGEKKADGEEVTLPVAKDAKILNAKYNKEEQKVEVGSPLESGLKNERFSNIEKGVRTRIITDDAGKTINEIHVFGQRKKKNV